MNEKPKIKNPDWVIQVEHYDMLTRTGRWITWRHPDGARNVARFGCFGKLKRFVVRHFIGAGRSVRAHNEATKEYRPVVTA